MAGMFNESCCWTCAHGRATGPIADRQWQCLLFRRRLPKLPGRLTICRDWSPYQGQDSTAAREARLRSYPEHGVLYAFENGYTPEISRVGSLDELPPLAD